MKFTKMHGCGNDYVYIDCRESVPDDLPRLAIGLSDRHKGVGADGIILICKGDLAPFKMRIFNADGSEGKMCGNGIRCVAKYLFDNVPGIGHRLDIDTLSGVKHIVIADEARPGDEEIQVTVDMGEPVVESTSETITLPDGTALTGAAVSMGNPHFVTFIRNSPTDAFVHGLGPLAERHSRFPDRTNVEFARVLGRHIIEMRVWERGSGETMACGTGACATAVAAIRKGLADGVVTVRLLGGDLRVSLDERGHVLMQGPATTVFEGEININQDRLQREQAN